MTSGIISAVNRAVEVDGKTMTLLQTSAALNNGNSGGPLINAYGQVIGINTLKMSTTDSTEATVEGLGFALPISSVSFVVNDLIANGHYRAPPPWASPSPPWKRTAAAPRSRSWRSAPAPARPMRASGRGRDPGGRRPGRVRYLRPADGPAQPIIGDTVTLTILRDGQQFDVEVTLRSNRSFG